MSTLNAAAEAELKAHGISHAEWARRHFMDGWHGDVCGCPDDRCIGYHHDGPDDCECLPALLTQAEPAIRHAQLLQFAISPLTLDAIQAEATRAHLKHGQYSMLSHKYSQSDRLAILVEEVGEVAHELTYDQGGPGVGHYDRDKLVKELIQVAAMAASWIEYLEGAS